MIGVAKLSGGRGISDAASGLTMIVVSEDVGLLLIIDNSGERPTLSRKVDRCTERECGALR
jgi:hypothetical protein